jgi:DNA polymerase-3 subunit beta
MLRATVLANHLKEGLSFSSHGISSRSQLPILLNFLIQAQNGRLIISATDLEVGLIVKIPAKIEDEGAVTVPAKTLFDLISSIEEEKVDLEEKDGSLHLKGAHVSASFPTMSAADFPKLYEDKGEKQAEIDKKIFDKEVGRVVFSSSLDSGRPALSGILIKKEEKDLVMVATDGFRLSLKSKFSLGGKTTIEKSLLIPSRVVKEILSIKTDENNPQISVFASSKNNQVVFEVGDYTVVGRLIEAEYPAYEKIIPDDFTTSAVFDRLSAQNAVRACSVFAREAANIVKIAVSKNQIKFSASASSVGEDEVEVEAKTEGEDNEIAFNARYLLDLFSNVDSEQVEFQMTGPLNAGVFKIPGEKDFLHLIMPIRVQDN